MDLPRLTSGNSPRIQETGKRSISCLFRSLAGDCSSTVDTNSSPAVKVTTRSLRNEFITGKRQRELSFSCWSCIKQSQQNYFFDSLCLLSFKIIYIYIYIYIYIHAAMMHQTLLRSFLIMSPIDDDS
uniref:Uncharacterized protein n=1 Tax=Brassica oleracea var. oleracea TaxID=109376 RepID=A0A0D2ZS46_BRAOL